MESESTTRRRERIGELLASFGIIAVVGFGVFGIRAIVEHRRAVPATEPRRYAAAAAGFGIINAPPRAGQPLLTVQPEILPPALATPPPAVPFPPSPAARSAPDLAIRIVDVGTVGRQGSTFMPAASVGRGERPAIVFDVLNIGTAVSGRWQFTANAPAGPFVSAFYQPLGPGEGVRLTVSFPELRGEGGSTLTVGVAPWSPASDADQANNTATAVFVRGY